MLTNLRQRFLALPKRGRVAVLAAIAALLLVVSTSAWGLVAPDDDTIDAYLEQSGLKNRTELRVGVLKDQPLLSYAEPQKRQSTRLADHSGFDVEIIRALAAYLGFTENSVRLIDTQVQNRGSDLSNDLVDVVVASFSMTPQREEEEVNFAGPYLTSKPEVLMRADDRSGETISIYELGKRGERLCTVGASTSDEALRRSGINNFIGVATGGECVDGLLRGKYDAFMLDDVVLAGYKADHAEQLKLVDLVLNQNEKWGIAVANDDEPLRQVIGNFLLDSYERRENGAWQRAWNRTLGRVLSDRRQPEPDPYQRLRDYRDRIQAQAQAQAPLHHGAGLAGSPPGRTPVVRARSVRRSRRPR
ncbi:transporter substrate-binding domain-containing protein [Micromonospora sp. CPCC 206060]|uniref:transporter substrate-binding domain-containing protein n=1 Tax=Micromonospora sp. CPCC 206060 TaxID=3122406 RepID=UPI002FF08C6E